jgi:hypothetical protein
LQQSFVKQAVKLGLYEGNIINLDFHTIPHFGEESVLEDHWAGARNKTMKGAGKGKCNSQGQQNHRHLSPKSS